ncbi:ABC transporter permease [Streptococcus saliviloxodontae]|uniref:ABC-type transport system involved in multi-copper enzyme maturation permease subunit n=1 Tax=Streptococcus saliviloxodontae TaxID=1349416 RepID=A0ABS2PLM1_9STRE|nr:ABC transporter permease [Streptococcus saliviloxodontae]MBM7636335.1 ABC-type transport system involved in multi-copper enzyme maturation permease subunit [Streptococcus saliviloxodontae]
MKGIFIEWLKSKRTKSFSIVTILMLVATLWNIATFMSVLSSHPDLRNVGTLFSNQNVNLLMLPIAICVFATRIVANEREGQTFKLQAANGQSLLGIFYHKFLFIMVFFAIMFVIEIVIIYLFGTQTGISIPLQIIGIQFVGQMLAIFSLTCLYLTLAMILEKQGLLLALGLLGGFLGILLNPRSYSFVSLLNPLTGSGSLAPYKYQFLGEGTFTYNLDEQLILKFIAYTFYCLVLFIIAKIIIGKRVD